MQNSSFEVINLSLEAAATERYSNQPIARVNDHEVRISTMTEAYHWHCHPDSDESFLALEGGLFIDFSGRIWPIRHGSIRSAKSTVTEIRGKQAH